MDPNKVGRKSFRWAALAALGAAVALGGGYMVFAGLQERLTPGARPDGSYLTTSNQTLTPVGTLRLIQGARPKDLAVSKDGSMIAALCNGRVALFQTDGTPVAEVKLGTGAVGIAWTAEGAIYASGGDGKASRIVKTGDAWAVESSFAIDLKPESGEKPPAGNPQLNGLAIADDGKELYAALGRRNAVARVAPIAADPANSPAVGTVFKTDAAPYHMTLRGGLLAVSNRGGSAPQPGEPKANSSGTMVVIDRSTDASARGSLSLMDLARSKVTSILVGRQPSGLAFSPDGTKLAVANSDEDTVSIVDVATAKETQKFSVQPVQEQIFGCIPTDVAYSDDGKLLFVSCGGINAVAVVELSDSKSEVAGYIPTAWFPIAVRQIKGDLIVACSKGIGARPAAKQTKFGVHDSVGAVQFIKAADWADLVASTAKVAKNNRWGEEAPAQEGQLPRPVPLHVGEPSVFKHVVYIIKENLTYDNVLGDMKEGNGDPSLCLFGEEISPNHHALARQFVLLDNTYTSGTNSADGHQWTSSSIANGYDEQNYAATIRSYPYDGGDPLSLSPSGFLWTAARKKGITTRVFGEFVDRPVVRDPETRKSPSWAQLWEDYKSGKNRYDIHAETSQASLRPVLHPKYIGFPSEVSDQWRADQFLGDLAEWTKKGEMPSLSILLLPNNHTSGTTRGMPTPRAMVADNDLALGRIVEAISKSPFWKETLILVIEDDSQNGWDHVDGHRTAAFCISPYTRRGAVVSEMYNHTSFVRTMGLVLGFPALNRFDRSAVPLTACFTDKPDFAPFEHVPNKIQLDEMNPSPSKLSGEAKRLAIECAKQDWKDVDRADATVIARSIWVSMRPGKPFPSKFFHPNPRGDEDD